MSHRPAQKPFYDPAHREEGSGWEIIVLIGGMLILIYSVVWFGQEYKKKMKTDPNHTHQTATPPSYGHDLPLRFP